MEHNTGPMSAIVGQEAALTVLKNALESGRLAGSYLFTGPGGVGKATTAMRFASALCGAQAPDDRISRRIDSGAHPDVRVVRPTGKSHTIHIGQLWPRGESREHPSDLAMLRDLHFEPMAGPRRVFIIDGAEGLRGGNEAAGNSILKTLEEPPAYATFILTAESTGTLLPTIVSRCQVVRFGLLPTADIERELVQRFGVPVDKAGFLAAYCEGRIGLAVAMARSTALLAARDSLLDLADRALRARPVEAFKLSEELRKIAPKIKPVEDDTEIDEDKESGARDPILRALDMLALYFRDLAAVCSAGATAARIVNIDRRDRLVAAAGLRTFDQAIAGVQAILSYRTAIERNANTQLALDVLFVSLVMG